MNSPRDEIWDVFWEGPFDWETRDRYCQPNHVLYAIFGTHRVYGPRVLLYIGRTEQVGGRRFDEHDWWVQEESDPVVLYLASVGQFEMWKAWNEVEIHPAADPSIVAAIETLLIHAHQPAYNSQNLQERRTFFALRVFNSGRYATLLPEVSYRYYRDP